MKRSHLPILLYVFSITSLIISIYQFAGNKTFDGVLSLIYSSIFMTGAVYNHRKIRKDAIVFTPSNWRNTANVRND